MNPSESDLKNSNGNLHQSPLAEAENQAIDWQKVQVMDFLRLSQDNQRILNTTLATDRAYRNLKFKGIQQMAEEGSKPKEEGSPDAKPEEIQYPENEGNVEYRIDSPNQVYHYYSPPTSSATPASPEVPSMLAKVLPWILGPLVGAAGAGLGAWALNKPTPNPVNVNTTQGLGYKVDLVP